MQSERDATHSYLGEFEKQCITVPETYVERKFRREAENGWVEQSALLSQWTCIFDRAKVEQEFLHRHSVA